MLDKVARLDIRRFECPFTLLEVSKAIRELKQGQVLEIVVASHETASDVRAFLNAVGFDIEKETDIAEIDDQMEGIAETAILITVARRQK